jgi:cobalt/nickel transport system permease protein
MFRIVALYAKCSKLSKVDPLEKLVLCISCIVINGVSKNAVVPLINVFIFMLLHIVAKNPVKHILRFTFGIVMFSIISSITFVLDYGIQYSVILVIKTLSSALCLLLLSFTTPLDDVLYYFYKIDFLKDLCDIAKSTERFIILIEDECVILTNAIKVRGGFDSKKSTIRSLAKLAGLLFVNTLRRWSNIKESLYSRCYIGNMSYIKGGFIFSYTRFSGVIIYIIVIAIIN